MSRRRPSDDDLPPPGFPSFPTDDVPDPGMTIPFRRPTPKAKPVPVPEPEMDELDPEPLSDEVTSSGMRRRAATRSQALLHVPSLILGFSGGVLLTTMLCGVVIAVFTTFG
jgi:hypothetical protein